MRVRTRWNLKDRSRSIEEIGSAVAMAIWRISTKALLNLENEGFETETQTQRMAVIQEFMAFFVHAADRLSYEQNSEEDRQQFITALALKTADFVQDNMSDVAGPGDYRQGYVDMLNARMAEYAEFSFQEGEPGYHMCRYLGERTTETMGPRDRKWISDQVMDIEVPAAMSTLHKAMRDMVPPSLDDDEDAMMDELRRQAPQDY